MPEIARFYGIVIRMYAEPQSQHHRPHFHAYHQGAVGVFTIDEAEMIAGDLARRERRLVEAWAELHRSELGEDWQLLQQGRLPTRIAPLK